MPGYVTRKGDFLTGFVMVEQAKSIDFRARKATRIARASDELLSEVLAIMVPAGRRCRVTEAPRPARV